MTFGAATVSPWVWHAHPEVWLLVVVAVAGYLWAVRRWAPAGEQVGARQQRAFLAGVAVLFVGAGWPVHDLAEKYLLWVHMTQHLLFTLVVPPLLLIGTPGWLLRKVLGPVLPLVAWMARPLLAGLAFNAVIILSHWPAVVDATLRNEPLHFLAHLVLFTFATLMWLPVLSTIPEIRRLSEPGRMVYLFLQSVVPTVPASFLTFAERPIYRFYADAPRPFGLSAVGDQQLAGAMMKLGGGVVLWGVIVVIFFRWYADDQRAQKRDAVLTWRDVERELERTTPRA
ncbi:MAG TPA: cytochrome c oxidase assembly protein [Acidimicrobiales bacterium]|nr:cytochrome c oxidase assembly protein [Acidimicrobiales bacterium]